MKAAVNLLWVLLSFLGAVALAHVTGAINPHEKVNGLWLVVAAGCIYTLAYRFYGRWIARQVVGLNNQYVTPAVRLNDGVNFHPTNKVVLFGHHFAAIAGAGPLLGPVLAAQFGFMPGFLWLVIGAVLAGAVQDFIILVASMRRNGRSLPEIAHDELGSVTGTATAVAVLFIVVVALAGLGFAVVNALYQNAWGTFTIAMTIPIGLIMGFYLQKFRPGAVMEVSVLGVALLIAAVQAREILPSMRSLQFGGEGAPEAGRGGIDLLGGADPGQHPRAGAGLLGEPEGVVVETLGVLGEAGVQPGAGLPAEHVRVLAAAQGRDPLRRRDPVDDRPVLDQVGAEAARSPIGNDEAQERHSPLISDP